MNRRFLPLLFSALLSGAPALHAAVVRAGPAVQAAPYSMFGGVPSAWGSALGNMLQGLAPSPPGTPGLLSSLGKLNIAEPGARAGLAPVALQLSLKGYAPSPSGSSLFKDGLAAEPETAAADIQAAAAQAQTEVREAARAFIARARTVHPGEEGNLDLAAKLRMLSSSLSFYMSSRELAEVMEAFSRTREMLSSRDKARLDESIRRQVLAFGRMSAEGGTLAEELGRPGVAAPPTGGRRRLPKEWTLRPTADPAAFEGVDHDSLAPAFRGVPDDKARDLLAAQYLARSPSSLTRDLSGVELPPVLAYKAASLAWRDDLQGAFSEIGAAQKVSENILKIKGQKIIAASLSPYSREASDQRYASPKENPTSEDYTSLERLRQQLAREFDGLKAGPGKARFALATTARTSWGDGHAWLGIKLEPTPGGTPASIIIHLRLLGDRTRNQKDILGAVGLNALFGAAYHLDDLGEFVRGLGDGVSAADFEVDHLSVVLPDGREHAGLEGARELLKQGLARRILLSPAGIPVAPAQAARENPLARWSFIQDRRAMGIVAPGLSAAAPPQEEPILVEVVRPEDFRPGRTGNWSLLSSLPTQVSDLEPMFHPASKKASIVLAPISADSHSPTDFKAKRLNRESWGKGVFVDIGGYQSVVTRFFEASTSHAIFDSVSFPDAARAQERYGDQGRMQDKVYLKSQLDREFGRIAETKQHRRFVLAVNVKGKPGPGFLRGLIGLKLEGQPGRSARKVVVAFRLRGGTWQQRRNALAALGVNLLYYSRFEAPEGFLQGLKDDMPGVTADLQVLR